MKNAKKQFQIKQNKFISGFRSMTKHSMMFSVLLLFFIVFGGFFHGAINVHARMDSPSNSKYKMRHLLNLDVGDTFPMSVYYQKGEKLDIEDLSWKSTDKNVITISKKGVVTAKNKGVASVYVEIDEGDVKQRQNCLVFVSAPGKMESWEIDYKRSKKEGKIPWSALMIKNISLVKDLGGYYSSAELKDRFTKTAFQGMNDSFSIDSNGKAHVDMTEARPSFDSSAVYLMFLKNLSSWDKKGTISEEAWRNLKPYSVDGLEYPEQKGGVGCWGIVHSKGPGIAILVNQLRTGQNIYIGQKSEYEEEDLYWNNWKKVKSGDFLKLFFNEYIGFDPDNPDNSEEGCNAIFLKRVTDYLKDGTRDDIIYYWTSTGKEADPNGGYSVVHKRASKIYRAVATKITTPQNFRNATQIDPEDEDEWLVTLNEKGTVPLEEMLKKTDSKNN